MTNANSDERCCARWIARRRKGLQSHTKISQAFGNFIQSSSVRYSVDASSASRETSFDSAASLRPPFSVWRQLAPNELDRNAAGDGRDPHRPCQFFFAEKDQM